MRETIYRVGTPNAHWPLDEGKLTGYVVSAEVIDFSVLVFSYADGRQVRIEPDNYGDTLMIGVEENS